MKNTHQEEDTLVAPHSNDIRYREPLYDLSTVRQLSAGNVDFTRTLIRIFLDTIPANSSEMVNACKQGDWTLVSKLAHKLKSTVDMMRMARIVQDIRTIELDAKSHLNYDYLPLLIEKVDATIQAAAVQLRQEFDM